MKLSFKHYTLPLVTSVLLGMAPAAAQTELTAGHISPSDSLEGQAIDMFAAMVGERTAGAVTVRVFPSEQLGNAVAQIESTIIGNQDIYFGGSPEFERYSDGLKLLGLNWVVPSQEAFRKITEDEIWHDILLDPLGAVGLTVLSSNWERGPYRVMVSSRPIATIDDMNGLRFRIAPIETWRRSWDAIGVETVTLAWTDVYLGLTQGSIEAVTAPISLVKPMRFTEIAKNIVRTDEFWQILVPVINTARFEQLTPEQQELVRSAAAEAGAWFVEEQTNRAEADIAEMVANDGATFTIIDTAPGVERMQPVIREMEAEGFIPAGLYDRLQAKYGQ